MKDLYFILWLLTKARHQNNNSNVFFHHWSHWNHSPWELSRTIALPYQITMSCLWAIMTDLVCINVWPWQTHLTDLQARLLTMSSSKQTGATDQLVVIWIVKGMPLVWLATTVYVMPKNPWAAHFSFSYGFGQTLILAFDLANKLYRSSPSLLTGCGL